MGHLAVAMDGTVLVFKEERARKRVEVKRSEDGGRTWSNPIVVGDRVRIGSDMSDDGRYKGEHVGWSELGNVVVDETTGEIMVFAMVHNINVVIDTEQVPMIHLFLFYKMMLDKENIR